VGIPTRVSVPAGWLQVTLCNVGGDFSGSGEGVAPVPDEGAGAAGDGRQSRIPGMRDVRFQVVKRQGTLARRILSLIRMTIFDHDLREASIDGHRTSTGSGERLGEGVGGGGGVCALRSGVRARSSSPGRMCGVGIIKLLHGCLHGRWMDQRTTSNQLFVGRKAMIEAGRMTGKADARKLACPTTRKWP
jgi:hypothetical protein